MSRTIKWWLQLTWSKNSLWWEKIKQKTKRVKDSVQKNSTFPHRNVSAEGCKTTDWLKGRLPWDVKVVSLLDIRHLSDLTEHEVFHPLAEGPAQSQPWLGRAAQEPGFVWKQQWRPGTLGRLSGGSSTCFGAGLHPAMGTRRALVCSGLRSTELTCPLTIFFFMNQHTIGQNLFDRFRIKSCHLENILHLCSLQREMN